MAEQLAEEMRSGPGRSYAADVIAGDEHGRNTGACARYTAQAVGEILSRFPEDSRLEADDVLDHVFAPIMYRILFAGDRPFDGYTVGLGNALFVVR